MFKKAILILLSIILMLLPIELSVFFWLLIKPETFMHRIGLFSLLVLIFGFVQLYLFLIGAAIIGIIVSTRELTNTFKTAVNKSKTSFIHTIKQGGNHQTFN